MPAHINKELLRHLADLARLDLSPEEEEKLTHDLGSILAYFEELKSLDTSGVEPLAGGGDTMNVFRADNERESTNRGAGVEDFPAAEQGFLKIPPIFE